MKTVKVSELEGEALDWAVAKALGAKQWTLEANGEPALLFPEGCPFGSIEGDFEPSENWSQGGPLIEYFGIYLFGPLNSRAYWMAAMQSSHIDSVGDTPLIASCRAIVASKLGSTVEVPCKLD